MALVHQERMNSLARSLLQDVRVSVHFSFCECITVIRRTYPKTSLEMQTVKDARLNSTIGIVTTIRQS